MAVSALGILENNEIQVREFRDLVTYYKCLLEVQESGIPESSSEIPDLEPGIQHFGSGIEKSCIWIWV